MRFKRLPIRVNSSESNAYMLKVAMVFGPTCTGSLQF